jgi:hypothetical protein
VITWTTRRLLLCMRTHAQPGSTASRDAFAAFPNARNVPLLFSARVSQTSAATPPYRNNRRSTRNLFLPYIHRHDTFPRIDADNVIAGTYTVSPFASTSRRDRSSGTATLDVPHLLLQVRITQSRSNFNSMPNTGEGFMA